MGIRKSTDEAIKEFKALWGDRWDYSRVDYKNARTKIEIGCKEHNLFFEQTAESHLKKLIGCNLCNGRNLTTEQIKRVFKAIWGDRWDYSRVEYKAIKDLIVIGCKEHNIFFKQKGRDHKYKKVGCHLCNRLGITSNHIISEFKAIWGDRWDYSRVEYKNAKAKLEIGCKEHNLYFKQSALVHKKAVGCPDCKVKEANLKNRKDKNLLLKEFKALWGDRWDYSRVDYKNSKTKIEIGCKEHKVFFWQTADSHLNNKIGCPKCSTGSGYSKAHEAGGTLYIYKIGKYLKYGITNRDPIERAKQSAAGKAFKMLLDFHYVDAAIPALIERAIKKSKYITNQAELDGEYFDGFTETMSYSNSNLKILESIITDKEAYLGVA